MKKTIFHVHTYRCAHAGDERELEYIKKAVELGANEIIFTDHAPFPNNPFRFRMAMEDLSEYVETLRNLKEEYVGKIDVKIGLEIEYVPFYMDYYKSLKNVWQLDLLLLGQHFSLLSNGKYSFELEDKAEEARFLADGIITGMQSGIFQAVAHPDQIFRRSKKWNEEMNDISQEIKKYAVCTGTVLEQNISNMYETKNKRLYRQEFWNDMPNGLKTIYGVDAHSVAEMEENYSRQLELLNKGRGE